MYWQRETIEKHIRTHTKHSDEDRSAVTVLEMFLRSHGNINTNFSRNDKWPNTDGEFEYVSNPNVSRRPEQKFCVQIKGTHVYSEEGGIVKYSLKSLAFPAFIFCNVTLDPGILFVVLNPDCRDAERVFWKYMSVDFINSINYEQESMTISFTEDEEIKNTVESIDAFCNGLEDIIDHHSFIIQLENSDYSQKEIKNIIETCNEQITKSLDKMDVLNNNRDNVSKNILMYLDALCTATLALNLQREGYEKVNIRLAWEHSLLNIETKFLGTFFRALKYIGRRVPDDGQSERLMLKYYNFLWQIRKFVKDNYDMYVLHNLEQFPLHMDRLDQQYYELVADAVNAIGVRTNGIRTSRFYIQKKIPFLSGKRDTMKLLYS